MNKRGPSIDEIESMRDADDVEGLVEAYAGTRRRDKRRAILAALAGLGDTAQHGLLDLLGDEQRQRKAGAVLVELGEEAFPAVTEQLAADDSARRRGALHTVYLYARYRDLPAAHETLRAVAARSPSPELADPAARMAEQVDALTRTRNEEIDRPLAKIKASVDRAKRDRGSTVMRMYSSIHSGRMEARAALSAMRFAGVRHIIAVAPEYGEAAVGALLALGIEELGRGLTPLLAEALDSPVPRTRSLMVITLLCLRRARVPGAAEVLEHHDVVVTDKMDRRAALVYKRWVRER